MVSNLAGSLALVTCKEPLRVSIGNHMRQLLNASSQGVDHQTVEMLVQQCAADNLELGCMLIEKAATEKAMRDVDEGIAPSLQVVHDGLHWIGLYRGGIEWKMLFVLCILLSIGFLFILIDY